MYHDSPTYQQATHAAPPPIITKGNASFQPSRPARASLNPLTSLQEPAVLIIDEAGLIAFANRHAYHLLHAPPKPLWGQHYHTLFPAVYLDASPTFPQQQFAFTLTLNDRPLTATLTVSPITGLPGASKLFTITIPPNQSATTPTLNHLQRLAGLGTLTATTAHELNNPISIITTTLVNAQALLQETDTPIPPQLKTYLQTIEKNAWRCARLIDDLRIYTHQDTPPPIPKALNQIVIETLEMLILPFRHDHNITFHTNLASDLPPLACDPHQITQILLNLITNARDALVPQTGTITIRTDLTPNQDAFILEVRDSGPGIPPNLLNKIFDPFFTTKPIGVGTGLGLPIVTNLIARHNGRLTVGNHPKGGAIFTIHLPL